LVRDSTLAALIIAFQYLYRMTVKLTAEQKINALNADDFFRIMQHTNRLIQFVNSEEKVIIRDEE